jgi:hypothetical protein
VLEHLVIGNAYANDCFIVERAIKDSILKEVVGAVLFRIKWNALVLKVTHVSFGTSLNVSV